MPKDTNEIEKEIVELEAQMQAPDFWSDKNKAQEIVKKLSELKAQKEGLGKHDRGNAIVSIIAGAGGDDAEDFAHMLFEMYFKFANRKNWQTNLIHENQNDHGGYRNVSFEVAGKRAYGDLKNEAGVHRLVRISLFNANQKRHTSFALVEVLPKFSKLEEKDVVIRPEDLKIEFSRSSGPGGQNVNKRETAVRIVHLPSNIAVHVSTERSQEQNRELALSILRAKIFKLAEAEKKSVEETLKNTKNKEIEWGNQIRSYVLHPYKMVKDHRTLAETANIDAVLDGELDLFIDPERSRPR